MGLSDGLLFVFQLTITGTPCGGISEQMVSSLREETLAEALWVMVPFANFDETQTLWARFRQASGDEAVVLGVSVGLGRHPGILEILHQYEPNDPSQRIGRALGLLALGDGSGIQYLQNTLASRDYPMRRVMVSALLQISSARSQGLVDSLLNEADPETRLTIAEAYISSGNPRAQATLVELVNTPSSSVVAKAASALLRGYSPAEDGRLSNDGREDQPEDTLWSPHEIMRRFVMRGENHPALDLPDGQFITEAIHSMTWYAKEGGRLHPEPEALGQLVRRWFASGHMLVSSQADGLKALERLAPSQALALARTHLMNPQENVARAAVMVVYQRGNEDDIGALIEVARRSQGMLRAESLRAVYHLCPVSLD
ncbi:MAG: HEAT repeat domain-containing protein [Myxococcales bacterium]|nr:HEAT repeat domain-containing protein [Myxococcales bacterium]